MLVRNGRLALASEPEIWFGDFIERSRAILISTTAKLLIASSFLPPPIHSDPADRIIIATARAQNLSIVTRDRAILSYADMGHVRALRC